MDDKLKEAIETVRRGDKQMAQRQLIQLLDEDPAQAQGWYLLSLLVDSPQKQAAYLSKTLNLNPQHEKAKAQLAALKASADLAPTVSPKDTSTEAMDVLAQSETDSLPDWLWEAGAEPAIATAPAPVMEDAETAVPNDTLPDWLKEPAALDTVHTKATEEESTLIGKTTETLTKPDEIAANLRQTLQKPKPVVAKAARPAKNNTRSLNIILGLLIVLAIIVMIFLAYLLVG